MPLAGGKGTEICAMSSVRCLPRRPGHLLSSFLNPRCRSHGRNAATMLPAALVRSTLPLAICGTVESPRTPTSLGRKRAIVVASVTPAVSIALHSSSACCRTQSLGICRASSMRDPACTPKKQSAADCWAARDPRIWGALWPVGGSSRRCQAKRRICRADVNGSEPVSGTSRRNTSTCPGTQVCLREEETPLGRSSTGRPHMA